MAEISLSRRWIIYTSIAVIFCLASFAIARELEVGIFSPKRPTSLPANTIWIDAPPLPLTFAHGWWFGCEKQNANFDRCILIGHNDRASGGDGGNRVVSDESYLSCKTQMPLDANDILLRSPATSENMWISKYDTNKKWIDMAPVAFLQNGDILLPASEISQCSKFFGAKRQPSVTR
jgi:hypothetical protein